MNFKNLRKLAEKAYPGPWHVGHQSEQYPDCADIDASNGLTIAEDVVGVYNRKYLCNLNPQNVLSILDIIDDLVQTLKLCELKMRPHGCSCKGDHDDPSWCDERCGDYGKAARECLKKYADMIS